MAACWAWGAGCGQACSLLNEAAGEHIPHSAYLNHIPHTAAHQCKESAPKMGATTRATCKTPLVGTSLKVQWKSWGRVQLNKKIRHSCAIFVSWEWAKHMGLMHATRKTHAKYMAKC